MKWEIVIGLETHAQLSTRSKMFSGAATAFGAAPNTQACGVDIALPGVLPVANREAVAKAVRFGLAVNGNEAANINRRSIFARKNYFYPDLPKGYQISQYETPIVKGGSITIVVDGREKKVRLTRAHLEEDAGKSLHEGFGELSGIDLNRAGTPLLEIVSEPDMRSAQEAVAYAKALHALVRWIDICDGNMQEGSFRCDANVSVRPAGSEKLGTRCEIKNLNSFRFLERAIEFEARRQIGILEDGGKIGQETRLYDADKDETRSMRTKEEAHDYRYFPDPDLLPLEVSEKWISEIKSSMPALPQARLDAYLASGLSASQAALITASREVADFTDRAARASASPARLSDLVNWIVGPLSARLNEENLEITRSRISPEQLASLDRRVADGTLSSKLAKEVFDAVWAGEGDVDAIIAKRGLKQISDSGELEAVCDQVIAANAQQVADYRGGKERAFNSLVGRVMKLTRGKANPQQVAEILKRKLA
jgi:aspartyl-tRNA(Asn)/glutamyl-tRNA(Gln) amidotransferase subunit B